jgi:lysozyme
MNRISIAALALSFAGAVGIIVSEGYTDKAVIPIPGDVPTIGFGTTDGVKLGDRTDPIKAILAKQRDVQKFEGAIKQCVKVPLYQYEYDAYLSLAYNIGPGAFCGSTLVRLLNAGDYSGACAQVLRWNRAQGREVKGLTIRREREHKQCLGQ